MPIGTVFINPVTIINEVCPSAIKMENIFISCDTDKTSGDVELIFNAAQQNITV